MGARTYFAGTMVLTGLLLGGPLAARSQAAPKPDPPGTDTYSVQMFQGGSQHCWIAVWPPPAYDGRQSIPDGTKVQIKVYRSLDGGKTYGPKGVTILSGGQGHVGQGEKNARIKRWIDLKLKTPVDNKKPHAVWLAVSAVVNGVESRLTNRYLTFRYMGNDGRPRLIRYETPDINGPGIDDELARPLPQELPGTWSGEMTITRYYISPHADKRTREGCVANGMKNNLNKPVLIALAVDQIDLHGAPGLGGRPVDPSQLTKTRFPGEARLVVFRRKDKPPSKDGKPFGTQPMIFSYDYEERFLGMEDPNTRMLRMNGHFFQNATHYSIRGTFKLSVCNQKGTEEAWARGIWTVKKRKE